MNIVAIADQHGFLPEIPECDLLLIAGDICPVNDDHSYESQFGWLNSTFRDWLEEVPAKHIVGTAGNHDLIFESNSNVANELGLPWHYLQDSGVELEGFVIWGTPWQPWFYSWAFNLVGEEALDKKFKLIPEETDILLSHGAPLNYCDFAPYQQEHVGSLALLQNIDRVKPRLVVCGHIHPARGIEHRNETIIANCSVVDNKYRNTHKPMEFELR